METYYLDCTAPSLLNLKRAMSSNKPTACAKGGGKIRHMQIIVLEQPPF